jgi:predicted ATP-grasp superfamily ATP-dependent carboligase
MTKKVLVAVGFAEAISAPEVVWSLVDAGFKVVAFSRRGRHTALRHSRHVSIHEVTAPEADASKSANDLRDVLAVHRGAPQEHCVLLPLDDASLWLCDQISLASDWIMAGACGQCAQFALNKRMQLDCAVAAGFNVPQSLVISTAEELASYSRYLPLILRPVDAAAVQGERLRKGRNWICSDDAELARAVSAWRGSYPLLAQPYLEGTGEGIFGLATGSGVVAWSAHRRLRMMNPHGSGSSACVSQDVPETVIKPVERLIASSGWRGLFMVELLRDRDEKRWFVEFNGRAWGSTALSRRQGFEYPAWTVHLALDPQFTPDCKADVREPIVCRNLGRELMHVLFVARGPKSRAIRRWPSILETLYGVLRIQRHSFFYNWRPDDWRVFFMDCWYTIRNQMFKAA